MREHIICETCMLQIDATTDVTPPKACLICEDERQYTGPQGQNWTTSSKLREDHKNVVYEEEPGILGVGIKPSIGIGQRSLLIQTEHGNILWDCIPFIDDKAKDVIRKAGGIKAIAISHPHFLSACVDISEEFGASIYVSAKDKEWVGRKSENYKFIAEKEIEVLPGYRFINVGGHFPGSSLLHFKGNDGKGILATGDTVQFTPRAGFVAFMYSYPNYLPLPADQVERIKNLLADLDYDRIYAGWSGKVVGSGAYEAVQTSADRIIGILRGTHPRKYY